MTTKPDVTVIITAHREGLIAGVTARSALNAIKEASEKIGLRVQPMVVLDRPDDLTSAVLREAFGTKAVFIETDEGDPGQARNRGVENAQGKCTAFLDGDDLWSVNWLCEAWALIELRPDCVAHSAFNLIFGEARNLWCHIDSEGPLFDPLFLRWSNYWDAMSFARTDLYRQYPFKRNDLSRGFGHEDWHWNCWTYENGIAHKPVPATFHFKRRRRNSQMSLVEKADATVWPTQVSRIEGAAEVCSAH